MTKIPIKVAGNIVNELSEKIPSHLVALSELIKNAYDAGAKKVEIRFDFTNKILTIKDDGCGISEQGIKELFHIAKSSKQYGKKFSVPKNISELAERQNATDKAKTIRYTQGSKGLGFLAAFKFGDRVQWETATDTKRTFTVNYKELMELDDISNYMLDIVVGKEPAQAPYTLIKIFLREDETKFLRKEICDAIITQKIVNSFLTEDFSISLFTSAGEKTTEKINLSSYSKQLLYRVKFNSSDKKVIFDYQDNHGKLPQSSKTKPRLTLDFNNQISTNRYSIEADLNIYFKPSESSTPSLFQDKHHQRIPLIYINDNLFNNETIFDTGIMRRIKSSDMLPQIIGYIKVYSNDPELLFNSDRSAFQRNELTNEIIEIIEELNKFIQTKGANYRRKILEEIAGTHSSSSPAKQARMELKPPEALFVPSKQLNLSDYIISAHNSDNHPIEKSEITIYVDNIKKEPPILESITSPCTLTIKYQYLDPTTGSLVQEIIIPFKEKEITAIGNDEEILIPQVSRLPIQTIPIVRDLITQLNELFSTHDGTKFIETIACALRTCFELSLTELVEKYSKNRGGDFNIPKYDYKEISSKLAKKLHFILYAVKNHRSLYNAVASDYTASYKQLKNVWDKYSDGKIRAICATLNLGAHTANKHLDVKDLKEAALCLAYFVTLTEQLLTKIKAEEAFNAFLSTLRTQE